MSTRSSSARDPGASPAPASASPCPRHRPRPRSSRRRRVDARCARRRRGGRASGRRRPPRRGVRPGPRAVAPDGLGASVCGVTCVGDGARRYRIVLERAGAVVPPDASPLHVPRASLHAALAVALVPPKPFFRSTGACPTPYGRSHELRAAQTRARRPRRNRGDREGVLPDPVVALDVRERGREAELALDCRRDTRRGADRLPRAVPATSMPGT